MSLAKITLLGLFTFLDPEDLFKNMQLPTDIDREVLVNNILLRGADFEVLYPDPVFMQNMIGLWSRKWQATFEKWIKALSIEYNPLENYDRIEDYNDDTTGRDNRSGKITRENHVNNTGGVTNINENHITDDGHVTNQVSAFDSSDFQNDNKSDTNTKNDSNGSNVRTDDLHEDSDGKDITEDHGDSESHLVHHGRLHGNIGVTTSQQMLQSELDIATWNIYEKITDMFIAEFCIAVY